MSRIGSRAVCLAGLILVAPAYACVGTVREVGAPERAIEVDADGGAGSPDGGTPPPGCGDGVLDPGETCDPPSSCPSACDDGVACTTDSLEGSAGSCNARCTSASIEACAAGDGCCPSGCTNASDGDCSASCGDGTRDPGETCDPPSSCPSSCDDGNACTSDMLTGGAATCNAACMHGAISACRAGDGCCPSGCTTATDGDCTARCGDGRVDPGETCDPVSSCPTSCDDGNACTVDRAMGSAAMCTASCSNTAIAACTAGDGCCPAGCTTATDGDCRIDCTVAASWPAAWVALEDATLTEINRRRSLGASCGGETFGPAGPLAMQAQLRQAARCHSMDMGENDFFSHTGSDGSDPGARIRRAGYAPRTWGENIAAGYSTVADVVQGWMDSPGHCRNIMNGSFNETGVGYGNFPGTTYRHYWTQTFGAR
jgi:uncharacterized protein YkwD